MKAVTVAIAAAVVGSANAQDWGNWNTTTSATTTSSTTETANWGEWTSSTTTSSKKEDPKTTDSANWGEWTSTTSKKEDPKTTSSATESANWGEWTSSSTTTKKEDPKTTESANWGEWESTTSSKKKEDPKTTSSKKEEPKTTASSSSQWGEWEDVTSYSTKTGTITVTKTVLPASSSTSTESKKSTTSSASASVVTSTVAPAWSSNGWFGGAWPTAADGQCVMNVVTSYGHPTWNPVPEPTAVANSSSWAVWTTSSSSSKKEEPKSSSTDPIDWAVWSTTSTSSVKDPKKTSSSTTDDATWAQWTQTTGGAFYASSTTASSAKSSVTGNWSQGGKGNAGISPNGDSWGMTYSPYTANGKCKDASTVSSDIAKLAGKGFTSVRVYSTDCSTLQNVGSAARANNIKMILGVFISSTGIGGAQQQVTDIVSWAQWDIVELIVVGNEAIFNKFCSVSELAGFISSSKWAFQGAGYTGAVTTTEDLATWQTYGSELCSSIDVVAANLYAFFNPNTKAADAGTFIQAQIAELSAICGNKETYVMESGWPSAGQCNGVACPGKQEQATAIKAIQGTVGSKIVFFSFEDEQWKSEGAFGVEQHWGCGDVFADGAWGKW